MQIHVRRIGSPGETNDSPWRSSGLSGEEGVEIHALNGFLSAHGPHPRSLRGGGSTRRCNQVGAYSFDQDLRTEPRMHALVHSFRTVHLPNGVEENLLGKQRRIVRYGILDEPGFYIDGELNRSRPTRHPVFRGVGSNTAEP